MEAPNYGVGASSRLPPQYAQQENAPLIPKDNTQGKFVAQSGYNDVWASVLFVLNITGFVALNIHSYRAYFSNLANPFTVLEDGTVVATDAFAVDHSLSILILSSVAVAFALAFGYFLLMQRMAAFLVKFSFLASIILVLVAGVLEIMQGELLWGGLSLVSGLTVLFFYKLWASRMPFSILLLQTVTSVTRQYSGTVAVAFTGLFTQIAWSSFWIFSFAINYSVFERVSNCRVEEVENGKSKVVCDNNQLYMVMTYLMFVMFWNSEVIKNVVHVTVSGVFGVYYYFDGPSAGAPASPTLASAKRALTTSFGSICFGSLLIALLQTLRYVLNAAQSESDESVMVFLATCADCILSLFESLFEIFNKFAFTQVAIYGKPFVTAARDTWELIKDRGVDAIVNDNLVSNVLVMGSISVALMSGLYGYLFIKVVQPGFYQKENESLVVFMVIALEMILGAVMMTVPNNVIDSGVTATFVALAEDPQTLYRTKPELYQAIAEHYPRVMRNVRGVHVVHD